MQGHPTPKWNQYQTVPNTSVGGDVLVCLTQGSGFLQTQNGYLASYALKNTVPIFSKADAKYQDHLTL